MLRFLGACFFLLLLGPSSGFSESSLFSSPSGLVDVMLQKKQQYDQFEIRLYAPTKFSELRLSNPPRLVLDFDLEESGFVEDLGFPESALLYGVRASNYDGRFRVVFDLKSSQIEHEIRKTDASISLKFFRKGTIAKDKQPMPFAASALTASPLTPSGVGKTIGSGFSIDTVIVHFKQSERPVYNITLKNESDSDLFVTAFVEEVKRPGSREEFREKSSDLLISPKRIALKKGGRRTVRLLLRDKQRLKERVFRATFLPSDENFDETIAKIRTGIPVEKLYVRVGVGVLALSEPAEPESELSWKRTEGGVLFENTGNVNILISNLRGASESEQFAPLPSRRLYPGNQWYLKVPPALTLYLTKQTSDGYEEVIVKPGKHSSEG